MQIVICGHVDHGKSTVVGRLLADTASLPDGKLAQVEALCARHARPFEYAFLVDALDDERAQGITIDSARIFFRTPARDVIIIDAPGHIEFLKNMVTGAARADAALLVIDANEGIQENSRRHGYMMSMLGIRHLAILVNKMDLVGFDETVFNRVEREYRAFLGQVGLTPAAFIPTVARDGDNLVSRSPRFGWYRGPTVLDMVDAFPQPSIDDARPFRMPVQDVYKFSNRGDNRRIVAGTIESGTVRAGDEIVFYPSGKRSIVKSIEAFNRPAAGSATAGEAIGFTLREQIYVARGELAAVAGEPRPHMTSRLRVSLFWLGRDPLVAGRDYVLKMGTARATVRVDTIHRVIDASSLAATEAAIQVGRHQVAECTLATSRAVAFDLADEVEATSRFVIVDREEICGGGIVREALPDPQQSTRERVLLREHKWEPSFIAPERRAARFSQRPALLLITGPRDTDRKGLAKALESRLFDEGRLAYFVGMGNVLYGVDADIARDRDNRREHIRRLAEIANLMLDAGILLIVSAQQLSREEIDVMATIVDAARIESVWIGDRDLSDLPGALFLSDLDNEDGNVERIRTWLVGKGILS
jgi:bifunctional enzyme CysN/CysC